MDDPSDDRLVILNRRAVSRAHLFASARSLIGDEEPRGPALVVAQAAVEVGFETAIDFAMKMRLTYDPLREWVVSVPVRSWSPNNHNVRELWAALTGDEITQALSWTAYKEGLKWRDGFVHRASGVPRERQRASLTRPRSLWSTWCRYSPTRSPIQSRLAETEGRRVLLRKLRA